MNLRNVVSIALCGVLLVIAAAPWSLSPIVYAQGDCGDAPSPRLTTGERGTVLFVDGSPLNVRDAASLAGNLVAQIPEGTGFQVANGPVCADNIYWWSITTDATNGWIAEGAAGKFFVGPSHPYTSTVDLGMALNGTDLVFSTWNWERWSDWPDPLTLVIPAVYAGDLPALPVNLADVKFLADAGLNDAQKALLAQNGFVVVPGDFSQFDAVYDEYDENWSAYPTEFDPQTDPSTLDIEHGYFVTTDAMLHALHMVFDKLLTDVERSALVPVMRDDMLWSALQAARNQRAEVAGTALEEPARAAELYLAVGLELLLPGWGVQYASPDLAEDIEVLTAMAQASSGQAEIPFLPGYIEDFSQYRPRGHYAGDSYLESYFRSMMWLSRITFAADDARQTQIALLLIRALRAEPKAVEGWNTVNDTLSFLIGPMDDLSMIDYGQHTDAFFGPALSLESIADPALVAGFQAELKTLPSPRVNGLILPDDTTADEMAEEGRGFRLMGQRFTMDAYVMQELIYPVVGTRENPRLLPLGVDVASVVGESETGYQLAIQAGAGSFENYDAQTLKLAAETGELTAAQWLENVYGGWLWTLHPLWNRDAASYPPLMNTEAWLRKDVHTGLASWTELKHDTVLYVKQPMGLGGGGGDPYLISFGYVEPNPAVFARIAVVAALAYQGIVERGLDQRTPNMGYQVPLGHGVLSPVRQQDPNISLQRTLRELSDLAGHSARYAEIARKELAGEPLSEDEYWSIYGFGSYLNLLLATLNVGEDPEPAALVTDVASNSSAGIVLQEAIGNVDIIYVVVPNPRGGYQLVRGGVFSYYEWTGDINQRMTDAEWRTQVAAGNVPPRPTWINAFFAE